MILPPMAPDICRAFAKICASRLDPNVSAGEFVELVEQLLDAAATAAASAPDALADDEHDAPALFKDPDKVPAIAKPPVVQPPAKPTKPEKKTPAGKNGRPEVLAYDDRVRIRTRHQEALEGRQRVPRGFLPQLAIEFDCSLSTIKKAVYGEDGM